MLSSVINTSVNVSVRVNHLMYISLYNLSIVLIANTSVSVGTFKRVKTSKNVSVEEIVCYIAT